MIVAFLNPSSFLLVAPSLLLFVCLVGPVLEEQCCFDDLAEVLAEHGRPPGRMLFSTNVTM